MTPRLRVLATAALSAAALTMLTTSGVESRESGNDPRGRFQDPQPPQVQKPAASAPYDVTQITLKLDVDIPDKLALGKWVEADKTCTDIITKSRQQTETPEIRRILIRAYEARGRARLNIKDHLDLSHEDFYSLLSLEPDHQLTPPVSGAENDEYKKVKDATLGHVILSMYPAGTARLERIDGDPFSFTIPLDATPKPIDLVKGSYKVTAATANGSFDQFEETLTVAAIAQAQTKVLKLVRRTSTLSVVTIPAGAEVVLDGVNKGRTTPEDGSVAKPAVVDLQSATDTKAALAAAKASAVLAVDELTPETHGLQIRLGCFKPVDIRFTIVRQGEPRGSTFLPGDLSADSFRALMPDIIQQGAFRLAPATASVRLHTTDLAGALFLDGEKRDGLPTEPVTLCEGPHTVEVRGPRGRFIDARHWKASNSEEKLDVQMKDAIAIANLAPGQAPSDVQRKALDAVKNGRMLMYVPHEREMANAARDPGLAPDFWSPNPAETISREGRVERWRLLADKLQAQGLAALGADANPDIVRLSLLAPGSGVPSVLSINTQDPTSLTQARDAMSAPLPAFWKRSIGVSVVDADRVHGAVIVRVVEGTAAARAGLKVGSTIVRAGGLAIESVADWESALKKAQPNGDLVLDLKGPEQIGLKVAVGMVPEPLAFVPGTTALRGSTLPANVALVDLQSTLARPVSVPADAATAQAALISAAAVHKQLGNWKEALKALDAIEAAQLGDGAAAAAGAIAYLRGICLEKLERDADAQAEFKKAAGGRWQRMDSGGPLVWPLAQVKLRPSK